MRFRGTQPRGERRDGGANQGRASGSALERVGDKFKPRAMFAIFGTVRGATVGATVGATGKAESLAALEHSQDLQIVAWTFHSASRPSVHQFPLCTPLKAHIWSKDGTVVFVSL